MRKFLLAAAAVAAISSMSYAQEATNLWLDATISKGEPFYATTDQWVASTNYSWELGKDNVTVNLKDATVDRWQAQFPIITNIATSADKAYELAFDAECNTSFTALVKFYQEGDDNLYGILKEFALKEGETIHFSGKFKGKEINPARLLFDFGFCPANTTVNIKNISLTETEIKEIEEPAGDNLWDATKATLGTVYFAPGWIRVQTTQPK